MSALSNPLTGSALDEYVNAIQAALAVPPADAAALVTALETFDQSDAAKKTRLTQAINGFNQVSGRNLLIGQVTALAITTAGVDYAVGDMINVTTATGTGAAGRVSAIDGSGAILGVELLVGGSGYAVTDTATTFTTENGTSGVITATVAVDYATMLSDALTAILAA